MAQRAKRDWKMGHHGRNKAMGGSTAIGHPLFSTSDHSGSGLTHRTSDTSFLRDEDGLTEIIENAFDHSNNNKIGRTSMTSSRPVRRTRSTSSSGRHTPTGSVVGSVLSGSDLEDQMMDDYELDGKDRISELNSQSNYQQGFDAAESIFASFSSFSNPNLDTSHLRINNNSPHRRFLKAQLSISTQKTVRLLRLGLIIFILFLSLNNATKHLKHYGQKHRTGSIYHRRGSFSNNNAVDLAAGSNGQDKRSRLQSLKEAILKKQRDEISNIINGGSHVNVAIPNQYANLAELSDEIRATDIPLFWHIPRAGGSTVRELTTQCFNLTIASGLGKVPHDLSIESVKVLNVQVSPTQTAKYVNIDVYQPEGLKKAQELGLVSSGLVNILSTRYVLEASNIFTLDHRGRLFTLFRHPVDRAVSTFHYVQDTVWRRNHNDLADITIEEYFKSGSGENNWVTRFLTGTTNRALEPADLDVAKEILRRKCVVGLLEEKAESLSRFERMFQWRVNSVDQDQCHEKILQWAWPLKHSHEHVSEGSEVWNLILKQNEYDLQLYEFAKALFKYQKQMFP